MIRRSKLHWSRIILAVLLLLVTCSLDASLPRQAPQAVVHHPRLFFAPDDIEVLQQRASSTHAEIWAAIQAYVDTQVDMAPPPAAPRNGSQDDYRNYGNQLIPFAFACVLTGQATTAP
ncbi:MAG: hypothetical protein HC893_17045 [Chloroflexaceae bacterium]|nr:hypothetical protein [Chloroflexaceae bacterium]